MAVYRLRLLRPRWEGRLTFVSRALALELKNSKSTPKPIVDVEIGLMAEQEPDLPIRPWSAPEWCYPVTLLPAFEAVSCARRQAAERAEEYAWLARLAFFDRSRCVSMRHVLVELAGEAGLDVERFTRDWDSGSARPEILAESHHGWEELKVPGSPTFVLPSGRQIHNPGAVRVTWGPKYQVQRVDPPEKPWRQAFEELFEAALAS
jgi:hypothetical protein